MDACITRSGGGQEHIPPDGTRISDLIPVLEELTASIAHEVKQPLAAIVMNGEACPSWLDRAQPQIDKARASVAAIIRSARRSCEIIGQLRALSAKSDIPRVELNLKTFSMRSSL